MFGIFKKKSKLELLQKKYEKLMAEWHALSTTNRAEGDKSTPKRKKFWKRLMP